MTLVETMILLLGILCVLTDHVDASSMRFMAMGSGNPTGNITASAKTRSKLSCASYCLTIQSEIFNYVAPMCSCYDGSSVGATFVSPGGASVLYGKAQVNNMFLSALLCEHVQP